MVSDTTSLLWAKSDPYKSLLNHMIDVGYCAKALLSEGAASTCLPTIQGLTGLSQEQSIGFVMYLAALHDIGKSHPEFQKTAENLNEVNILQKANLLKVSGGKTRFRHEIYTGEVLTRIWQDQEIMPEEYSSLFSTILSMHHQGKSGGSTSILPSCLKQWHDMQEDLELEVRNIFSPSIPLAGSIKHIDALATIIMGLVILSDWIASSELFEMLGYAALDEYIVRTENTARRAIHEFGLSKGPFLPAFEDFSGLWLGIPREGIRPLQAKCELLSKYPAKLYLVEAPMGEGKTEAAIFLATHMAEYYGKAGLYVALPSAATSNQMHYRVNELFSDHEISSTRLLHAMAWLVDDVSMSIIDQTEDSTAVSQWLAPLRRGMLCQSAVGTVDQAMMSVLQVKYSVLRLLGLEQKVLIVDEIHSYDAYMNQIIDRLLSWCHALEIPVILLSATLPALKRKQLLKAYGAETPDILSQEYPLITAVQTDGIITQMPVDSYIRRQYHFNLHKIMNETSKIAELALDLSLSGGCICVLLNTVKMAQSVFRELEARLDADTKLILFHSRFTAYRRQEIENECVHLFGKDNQNERPQKAILVCTQVVEQSLDVDFDTMITQISPIDLLLQRAGRVHRHEKIIRPPKLTEPIIEVLVPEGNDYQGTSKVYVPLLLDRTYHYIEEHKFIEVPGQIREAIEIVYTEKVADSEIEKYSEMEFKTQLMGNYALGVILPEPHAEYFYAEDCNPQSLFMQEDRETLYSNSAKTRFDSETMKIALVEQEMIADYSINPYNKELAQKILMQSVTVRTSGLGAIPQDAYEGRGPLRGCLILPIKEDRYAVWNDYKIINNNKLGVLIERM